MIKETLHKGLNFVNLVMTARMKSIFKSGEVSVHLIASKSRLALIKQTTISRIELLGNSVLRRLMNLV